jgi:aldose sugar dehydrogenase
MEINMMWSSALPRVLTGVVATGLSVSLLAQSPQSVPPAAENQPYKVVTVAEGFQNPWSIAFLPDGDMLVTERPGRLRVVRNGTLLPEPVEGVPAVRAQGQGGLMEVLPHPDFANNRLLYLSLSKPNDQNQATTAIVRGRFEGTRLTDVEEIFVAEAWGGAGQHFGSKLAFDRDGYLFITVGDRGGNPNLQEKHPSQDLGNHQGTVIRLHDDGRVPSDNPFVGRAGAQSEIYSYGHRNPQGLAIHPETGDVWITEHGPQGGDELNLVRPGLNYGWPVVGHGVNYGGAVIHQAAEREGMESPAFYWLPSTGTSGLIVYTGDRFPEWRGNLLAGGLAGQNIDRIVVDGSTIVRTERIASGLGRVRDIRQGPDGHIYVAIDDRGGPGPGGPARTTAIVRLEPAS